MKVKSKKHFLMWLLRTQGQFFSMMANTKWTEQDRMNFANRHGINGRLMDPRKYRPQGRYTADEVAIRLFHHTFHNSTWNQMGRLVQEMIGDYENYYFPLEHVEQADRHVVYLHDCHEEYTLNDAYSMFSLFSEILRVAPVIVETIPAVLCYTDSRLIKPTRARYGTVKMINRLIGKFEKQMPDNAWPHYRERLRFASFVYKPIPTKSQFPAWTSQYVHLAKANEDNIAYTPNHQYLRNDRQVSVRPGRYLSREFPHLHNEQVKSACTKLNAEINRREWFIAKNVDEVLDIYKYGPESCMDIRHHDWGHLPEPPAAVYFSPDVSVAALKHAKHNGYSARCVVNLQDKKYGRLYGDPMLGQLLKSAGYESYDYALQGCRVRCINYRNDLYVMPYLDYISRVSGPITDSDGEWFIVDDDGDYDAQSTGGTMAVYERMFCNCCEDEFHPDSMRDTDEDGSVCDNCYDQWYIEARNHRGWDVVVHREGGDVIYSDRLDMWFVDSEAAVACGYVWVDSLDDFAEQDELVEDEDGEMMLIEDAFPIRDDCGDWTYVDRSEVFHNPDAFVAGYESGVDVPKLYITRTDHATPSMFVDGHHRPALQMLLHVFFKHATQDDWMPHQMPRSYGFNRRVEDGEFPFGSIDLVCAVRTSNTRNAIISEMCQPNENNINGYINGIFHEIFKMAGNKYARSVFDKLPEEQAKDSLYMKYMFPRITQDRLETINAITHFLSSMSEEIGRCMADEQEYLEELENPTTETASNG